MKPEPTNLALTLRAFRKQQSFLQGRNYGVRDLALEIGVSPATVSRLEQGHEYNAATLMALLAWLMRKREM